MKQVDIYTDGACIGNPGPGGYGAILDYKGHRREVSAGYRHTTNNRMELLAALKALELLKEPCEVSVFTDSQYLVQPITNGWTGVWQERAWRKADHTSVLNVDLWKLLIEACATHRVRFVWVRGHNGHTENERCDRLAYSAACGIGLLEDSVFEEARGGPGDGFFAQVATAGR